MRILICNKFYKPFGGPETCVRDMSALLEADGHEVIPFSMSHPDNWPSRWSDYFIPQVDYNSRRGIAARVKESADIIYSRESRRRITALLDKATPDLAHLHNIYHQISPSIFGPIKRRGIPVVMSLHDYKLACPNMLFYVKGEICERCSGGRFHNAVKYKCVKDSTAASVVCALEMYIHRALEIYQRNVDVFISPSRFLIDALTRCGAAGKRMVHIPNIAEVDSYTPTYDSDGYVLYFGKLTPEKGVETLIRAVSEVKSARLVAAGTGAQSENLKAMAEKIAPGRIEFAGFLTGDKLRQAIERCAFFVIPSEWYENCPCTVLEAYSAGKPVVGSRIGGIPELIDDGKDGFLFEPGNHQDLSDKISLLLSDPRQTASMGREGRRKMENHYSRESHYRRLLEIYNELTPS